MKRRYSNRFNKLLPYKYHRPISVTGLALAAALLLVMAACAPVATPRSTSDTDGQPVTLVVGSHDSFGLTEEFVADFEQAHNVRLQFLQMGDAGEALNKLILSKDAPLADVFFGVDNTFLSRALNAGIFEPYKSPALDVVPDQFELDPEHRLTPIDYGFVNINADWTWFEAEGLPVPTTLEDLAEPEYAGLLVVENPATSSPGLAFLLATIGYFGEDGYLDFWAALRDNDVLVTDGWSTAYYEHFTVGSGGTGDRPLVVSYSTSPPADVVFATDGRTEPASVNVSPDSGTFRQIEFAGIVTGTQKRAAAEAFIDLLLSDQFQSEIPLQMFVYPASTEVGLPQVFVDFGQTPDTPADIAPQAIEENREAWIEAWTTAVLR